MIEGTLTHRMRAYESEYYRVLPRRSYTVLRMDGSNFKRYTANLDKPFDHGFAEDMMFAAEKVCARMSGSASFAYVASDEISVLLTDFANENTGAWYGGVQQKMVSVAASLATAAFNAARAARGEEFLMATFDARVLTLPDEVEAANYFVWRQRDTVRNSISMACAAHFPHGRVEGLNSTERVELLREEAGVDWNSYPEWAKRGSVISRVLSMEPAAEGERDGFLWDTSDAPEFNARHDSWLDRHILPRVSEPERRCLSPAKERYRTIEFAEAALNRLIEKFGDVGTLHPYECSCGLFHLGRSSETWLRWNDGKI